MNSQGAGFTLSEYYSLNIKLYKRSLLSVRDLSTRVSEPAEFQG